jgi:hypothetical protein
MFFVLDEAVVRRWIGTKPGDATVMRGQFRRLEELAGRPNISIQIVRFREGVHRGLNGSFTLLEFPDAEDDDLLFLETGRGSTASRDNQEETAQYKSLFFELEDMGTPPDELGTYLAQVGAEMTVQGQ